MENEKTIGASSDTVDVDKKQIQIGEKSKTFQ